MKLKIVRVDMDGYCGRDNHPSPSDVGLVVIPLAMETILYDGDPNTAILTVNGGVATDPEVINDCEADLEVMWTCLTRDNRTLCLMGHEVEVQL